MLPLLLIVPVLLLRLLLLARQQRVLRAEAAPAYARAVVMHRSGQLLWQSLWALILLATLPAIAALEARLPPALLLWLLALAGWLWELPAKAWKPFVTDARHGFNRLSAARFLREQAGRLLLFAVAAAAAALFSVQALRLAGTQAWLPIWLAGWTGWWLLRAAQPVLIAPLFDVIEPLPAGALRERLQALLRRCGVSPQRLFVLRSSARTAQANAQVSGGLAAPRIVLGDTLIAQLPPEEIEAVVAHELGHLQRGHLRLQALMLGASGLLLVALAFALTASQPGAAARLALAWALLPSAWQLAQPLANAMYRRFEFEADEAAAHASSAEAMAAALRRLTRHNANAVRSDRWYERVYHTHPALAERLARLEAAA